jgi:tRNA-modifying protein YgfZ
MPQTLHETHLALGAALAGDGIPLHYGDVVAEYHAALDAAVLMDRSHEGRLQLTGRDRLTLPHRISTNDIESLTEGESRPTIFTNPNARILDRAWVVHRGDSALLLTEPGRGAALMGYIQRNIFFNDDVQVRDLSTETHAFALHGAAAGAVLVQYTNKGLKPVVGEDALLSAVFEIAGAQVVAVPIKPVSNTAYMLTVPREAAAEVWRALLEAGQSVGLRAAGSLVYNALRIRAGRPGVGRELSSEYIPLEVGLWDEVSFSKGCYTGQEIIARMESRGRLARTMVRVTLDTPLDAPAELTADGKSAGMLTSAVTTPDGEHIGIAVVKMAHAQPGRVLRVSNRVVTILDYAGVQPMGLQDEASA